MFSKLELFSRKCCETNTGLLQDSVDTLISFEQETDASDPLGKTQRNPPLFHFVNKLKIGMKQVQT